MAKRYYQLQELLEAVNARLAALPELDQTEFTKRTIYYYVQEGLLPRVPGLRRGPRTPYPAEFVDRLLFIRRLQSQEALSLDHIREVLADTPPETIERVANGKEEVRLARVGEAVPRDDEQTVVLSSAAPSEPDDERAPTLSVTAMTDVPSQEETLRAGPWATLVVARPLSDRERRLLQRIAVLVEEVLEEDE